MNVEIFLAVVRHLLAALGVIATQYDWISQSDFDKASGALIFLFSILWSIGNKQKLLSNKLKRLK